MAHLKTVTQRDHFIAVLGIVLIVVVHLTLGALFSIALGALLIRPYWDYLNSLGGIEEKDIPEMPLEFREKGIPIRGITQYISGERPMGVLQGVVVAETKNTYDPFAIAVFAQGGDTRFCVGYLPADMWRKEELHTEILKEGGTRSCRVFLSLFAADDSTELTPYGRVLLEEQED